MGLYWLRLFCCCSCQSTLTGFNKVMYLTPYTCHTNSSNKLLSKRTSSRSQAFHRLCIFFFLSLSLCQQIMFLKNVDFDVTFSNKQLDNVTEIIFFLSFFFHLLILKQRVFSFYFIYYVTLDDVRRSRFLWQKALFCSILNTGYYFGFRSKGFCHFSKSFLHL